MVGVEVDVVDVDVVVDSGWVVAGSVVSGCVVAGSVVSGGRRRRLGGRPVGVRFVVRCGGRRFGGIWRVSGRRLGGGQLGCRRLRGVGGSVGAGSVVSGQVVTTSVGGGSTKRGIVVVAGSVVCSGSLVTATGVVSTTTVVSTTVDSMVDSTEVAGSEVAVEAGGRGARATGVSCGRIGEVVTDTTVTANVVVVSGNVEVNGSVVDAMLLGRTTGSSIVAIRALRATGREHEGGRHAEHDDARPGGRCPDGPRLLPPRSGRWLVLRFEEPLVLGR